VVPVIVLVHGLCLVALMLMIRMEKKIPAFAGMTVFVGVIV
jgi:hypothetical protein